MQVSNAIMAVAAEACLALAIGAALLFIHARKLKSLVRRQQEKLVELLKNLQPPVQPPPPAQPLSYKSYLNSELDATSAQFSSLSNEGDITQEQSSESPLLQRILALRYAFLRAEELGTTEEIGTPEYWSIFEQTLAPLLNSGLNSSQITDDDNPELTDELETARKRIENLEKFKRLFFEMEKQWNEAKTKAQDYYLQLMALSEGVSDREGFNTILESYHNIYDNVNQQFIDLSQTQPGKTIHITRQDPRAADEIVKLRNVAADQHRIINQLQRKLIEAKTAEDKELIIQELQQQLQRQTRFVQESETCVQLLEEELSKVHQELSIKERALDDNQALGEENLRMKTTLQSFTLESKDLMQNIDSLEKENNLLRQEQPLLPTPSTKATAGGDAEFKQLQAEYIDLQKQYAELEEKYLDLKLGG